MRNKAIISFLFGAVLSFGQSVPKTMLRLPDTGQHLSYTNTFGEDHDYTLNPPFFINNGDGTVTDTVTGLMWQQTDGGEMTIENAELYCSNLTLGGYSDWRLPDAHESFSILNHQNNNPALSSIFTVTGAEYWWTSDRQANNAAKIWVTNAGGGIGNHSKTETVSAGGTKKFHARAVRDVQAPVSVPAHWTLNNNGTITDHLTLLTWQHAELPDSLTWENALQYAETLTMGGYSDWRLPNIKELQSINEESLVQPSVNTTFFNSIKTNKYWSSTSLPNQTTRAWYLDTNYGITTYDLKIRRHYVICVRGGTSETSPVAEASPFVPQIAVFPNPAFDRFFIQMPSGVTLRMAQLFSLDGKLLQQTNTPEIAVDNIGAGLFLVKIYTDQGIFGQKLTVRER